MFFLNLLRSHTFLLLVTLATVVVAQSTSVDDITTPCGPNIYCLPLEGALWLPQQNRFVRWNSKYPTFAVAGFVNISLYNTQSTNPVRQWPLYENAEGLLAINSFDSNWFIGAALVQKFYFIILGPNDNPSLAQSGPVFSIQSSLSSTPSPTSSITNSVSPTSYPKPSGISSGSFPTGTSGAKLPDHESGGLSVGAICGIAVGSVLLVTAVACLIYVARRRQKNHKKGYDFQLESESGSGVNGFSAASPAILATARDNSSNSDADSTIPMSESLSPTKRNSLCLTVKGAQELAHAYRKMLTNQDATEESTQQGQQRSLYSDELLRRELAADGHGVKNVLTSPAIVVAGDDQMSLHSMTVDPSEPDPKP